MSKTCKCAIFDADDWCFNCTLTKDKCTSGKHFPDFDICQHKSDDSFIYENIKEKFDMLFPDYAKKVIFWSPCKYKDVRGFTSIIVVIDGYKPFIFDYKDDNNFGLYAVGCDLLFMEPFSGADLSNGPDLTGNTPPNAAREKIGMSLVGEMPKELAEKILKDFNKKEEV